MPRTTPSFLIDMDGTLVDSHVVVENSWQQFAERHQLDATVVIRHAMGRPTTETVNKFLTDPHVIDQELQRIIAAEELAREGIIEVPGAREFVRQLDPATWALVTSATRQLALNRLALVGIDPPPVCVFGEDIQHGKPHPEPYQRAAQLLGTTAGQCIVLEDSEAGIQSGIAAGATVIVVGDTPAPGLRHIGNFLNITPDQLASR